MGKGCDAPWVGNSSIETIEFWGNIFWGALGEYNLSDVGVGIPAFLRTNEDKYNLSEAGWEAATNSSFLWDAVDMNIRSEVECIGISVLRDVEPIWSCRWDFAGVYSLSDVENMVVSGLWNVWPILSFRWDAPSMYALSEVGGSVGSVLGDVVVIPSVRSDIGAILSWEAGT